MLRAGQLDQRVTFEQPIETRDPDYGTASKAWSAVATVWAAVEPGVLRPRESEINREVTAVQYTRVRCRWSAALGALTPKARINLGGGRLLQIDSIANARSANEEIVCMCTEFNAAGL